MNRWIAPMIALAAVGCWGPEQYSAPAPAGAAECALREAAEMGYPRLEGREDRGAVRIGRHIAPSPGREPTDPGRVIDREEARLREGQFESQLRISERDGVLRIAILSEPRDRGDAPDPGGPAGDARLLLVRCTTPATP